MRLTTGHAIPPGPSDAGESGPRPRVAWVAPHPEAGCALAEFALGLYAELLPRFDLRWVAATPEPAGATGSGPAWLTLAAARRLDEAAPFDLWVYHLGDDREYACAAEQARRRPGVALAHDAGVGDLPAALSASVWGAFDPAAWAALQGVGPRPVALLPRGATPTPVRPSAHAKLDADLPLDRLVLAADASGRSGDAACRLLLDALGLLAPNERAGVLAVALGGTPADAQRRQSWGVGLAARPASPGAMARLAAGTDVLASPPGGRSGEAALRALACGAAGGVPLSGDANEVAKEVARLLREPGRRRALGAAGRARAAGLPLAASARALAALFDAALARRTRHPAASVSVPTRATVQTCPPAAPAEFAPSLWVFVPHLVDGHRGQFNGVMRVVVSLIREWLAAGVPGLRFGRLTHGHGGRLYVAEVPVAVMREHLRTDPTGPIESEAAAHGVPEADIRPGDVVFAPEVNPIAEIVRYLARLRAGGVRLVPLIYDLIACRCPQYFGPSGSAGFWPWARDLIAASDLVVADSRHTKTDVHWFADAVGVPAPPVEVCRLGDGGLRAAPETPEGPGGLRAGEAFALCCCTIEVRKNHRALYEVWRRLVARLGPGAVPRLVLLGKVGWLVNDLVGQMRADPLTRDHVVFLSGVDDAGLAWLYRGAAFTLYPSLYEGWGLPVAEALACGKVVVASDASSIPEIGGPLVDYHAPLDLDALEARVLAALDPAYRARREAQIRAGYRPTAWADTARQVLDFMRARFGVGSAA